MIEQGDVFWVAIAEASGSEPGSVRPVVVVQGDGLNRSRLRTVVCVPLTSNLHWAEAPGNVLLPAAETGLRKDSVANATQLVTLDRTRLGEQAGSLDGRLLYEVLQAVDVVLGR